MEYSISQDFFCIELKICTVVTLITEFHDMSTVTFPWQHNMDIIYTAQAQERLLDSRAKNKAIFILGT